MVKAIWCQTPSGGVSKGGGLPWDYPEEMTLFKAKTVDGIAIMGHNTWKSLNEEPLNYRHNIVISSDYKEGMIVDTTRVKLSFYKDITPELLHLLTVTDKDVWCIGGTKTIKKLWPYITECHVSVLNTEYDCDTRCDILDSLEGLKKVHEVSYPTFTHHVFEVIR